MSPGSRKIVIVASAGTGLLVALPTILTSLANIGILPLWVYYSGLIFYFGAEFTKLYADRYGSRKSAQSRTRIAHAA
jgi:uncharacterized BrkB/YihY/UPF0761 family membrane protein